MQIILRISNKDFDFLEAKKEDLKDVVRKINTAQKKNGEAFAESYKNNLRAFLS